MSSTPAMFARIRAIAASAPTTRASRERSVQWLHRRGRQPRTERVARRAVLSRPGMGSFFAAARQAQRITDAADGVDQRRLGLVDLATEVVDVRLDDTPVAAEVVLPDPVQDLRLADHPARVDQQVTQEVELGRR